MGAEIKIENIGPIEALTIPVPAAGGVVVLRGQNGTGKTHALEATAALVNGKGSLAARDGAKRGEVEGFQARITVGRSTRRTGELECITLEGRLNVADLVDPGLKDAGAADARRIRALVSLSGTKPDPEAFYGVLPGGKEALEAIAQPKTLAADDLVEMGLGLKRDLETAARAAEAAAENLAGQIRTYRLVAAEVDTSGERDAALLQRQLEGALQAEAAIQTKQEGAETAEKAAKGAAEALDAARATYQGPTVAEALAALEEAEKRTAETGDAIHAAEMALRAAEEAGAAAETAREIAKDRLKAAQGYAKLEQAAGQAMAAASGVARPTMAEVAEAARAVTRAREALEHGAAIRRALEHTQKAEAAEVQAKAFRNKANVLRDAAQGIDDVLSRAVASPVLRVEAGRLVTDTAARGPTAFAELSHGERWRIALDLAADQVGVGGLIVVPQEAWEALDPKNRAAIAEHARERRVLILTAEASDGPLTAETFGERGAA